MELLDKRGYLTISLSIAREGKILLRKPEGIRDWFAALKVHFKLQILDGSRTYFRSPTPSRSVNTYPPHSFPSGFTGPNSPRLPSLIHPPDPSVRPIPIVVNQVVKVRKEATAFRVRSRSSVAFLTRGAACQHEYETGRFSARSVCSARQNTMLLLHGH